ncbi:MAG TPA: glycosyltransferase, partial [Baekduia sp.]|nr:glycosyltransferase [Baekduia sp.]
MQVLVIEQGGRGGVADYTSALVSALAAAGTTVDLATATDHRYPQTRGVRVHPVFRYLRDDRAVGRLLRRARLGRVGNGVLFLAAIPRLMVLARRADVVHTEGWEDLRLGVVAVAALRAVGATVVQTEHNTFERGGSLERPRALLARMTARTVVHADADLPRAYASERGAAVVIPHGEYGGLARTGGDGDRDAARAALGIPPGAPAVLLFGQLRADKGLGDLLRAARAVPGLHVIVAGEDLGAPAAEADQLAAPELAGRLHLRAEFIPMSDAADLFAAADAVVLPYPRASQSGVLLLAYG